MPKSYSYKILKIEEYDLWNKLCMEFGICYQTSYWGNFKTLNDSSLSYYIIGIYENEILIGGSLVFTYKVIFNVLSYIPWGPLIKNNDLESYNFFLKSLYSNAEFRHVMIIKIDPGVLLSDEKVKELYKNEGYESEYYGLMPQTTFVMDTSSNESINKNIKSKYRGRIRNKGNFKFEIYSSRKGEISEFLIDSFYEIYVKTGSNKGFSIRSKDYIKGLLNSFLSSVEENIDAYLCFVKSGDKYIAASINTRCGSELNYLYSGAESSQFYPGYYMVYSVALFGHNNNATRYNLWGGTSSDKKDHAWRGFTDFKINMGGVMNELLPTQTKYIKDKTISLMLYRILRRLKLITF